MPDAEFGSRRRQVGVVAASVVAVVAVVAAVALVHPGRTSPRSPAASIPGPVATSNSPLVSPAASLPAVSGSEPAVPAPAVSSPAVPSGSLAPPRPTPSASHRPSATAVVSDSNLNFKVSVEVSPSQAIVGHKVRVTVSIVNEGGVFDRPVLMFFQGSDPSDNAADATAPCTASYGGVRCPITGVRPGRTWSYTFSFIPGDFPAMDHFDDTVYVAFNYTDNHGDQQQTPTYDAHVLLSNAPSSSLPPATGTPTDTPLSPASPPPTTPAGATPIASSTGDLTTK